MQVLLTWVGGRDPRWQNTRNGEMETGPVLGLLEARRFDQVYLLHTVAGPAGDFPRKARQVAEECRRLGIPATPKVVDVASPTDYEGLFEHVKELAGEVVAVHGREGVEYFVFLSPGTPQMQSTSARLVQTGVLPARLIKADHPRLRSPGAPAWHYVEPSEITGPDQSARRIEELEAHCARLRDEVRRLEAELAAARAGGGAAEAGTISPGFHLPTYIKATQRAFDERALRQANGDIPKAAGLLGEKPPTYRKRLREYRAEQPAT